MPVCYYCHDHVASPKYGLHRPCFKKWFELKEEESDFYDLYLQQQESRGPKQYNTSFFHGAFEKYSAVLEGKSYILKLSGEYPDLPAMEFLCNQIACALGLKVPSFYLIEIQPQKPCFVTYNFMQDFPGCDLKHIYHFLKSEDFSVTALLSVIKEKTGRLQEVRRFIHLCLFDAFIGNHDRHGRNLGLIVSPKGLRLSPFYDNPSYFAITPFLEAENNPRGRIRTEAEENPTLSDYIEEFKRVGYREEISSFFKAILLETVEELIKNSFVSQKCQKAFLAYIQKQYQGFKDVCKNF